VGLESNVFDPEFIKSKIENVKKSIDKTIMILLKPVDLIFKKRKHVTKEYSTRVKILYVIN